MSGASSSSPPVEGANPNHQGTPEDAKPRLTEEEKKQNHIASGKSESPGGGRAWGEGEKPKGESQKKESSSILCTPVESGRIKKNRT